MNKQLKPTVPEILANKFWFPWNQCGLRWYRKDGIAFSTTGITISKPNPKDPSRTFHF
jgi:hypothetical protein